MSSARDQELCAALAAARLQLPAPLRQRLPSEDSLPLWLDALDEELGEGLGDLAERERDALLEGLVALGERAAGALARAGGLAREKGARKAIGRAIHRLRSRGVRVESERAEVGRAPSRGVLRPVESEVEQAWITPIDPRGVRAVWIVQPAPGGARVCEIAASDSAGVLHVEQLEGRRRDVRRLARELFQKKELRIAAVDPASARAWLRRVESLRREPRAAGLDEASLAQVLRGPDSPTPGEQVRARMQAQPLSTTAADSALRERMQRGAIPPWPLEQSSLEETARRLDDAERSPLVLSAIQKRERREEALREAAERLLDAASRERIAARLEETAYQLESAGDLEGAAAAVSVAHRVRAARSPLEVEYLQSLLEQSLEIGRRRVRDEDRGRLVRP
jgi:hypothetical protein